MRSVSALLHLFILLLAAPTIALAGNSADPHSYAQPDQVTIKAMHLDLDADFASQTLAGSVELALDWHQRSARELVLDSRDLSIERVELRRGQRWRPADYALAEADPILGSRLSIDTGRRQPDAVRIHYRTAPTASGLQWLGAEQTLGKREPFMFSQSQAIHARSWVPLQDTPAVRYTYSADIQAPAGLLVLMSAENPFEASADGRYRFTMEQPIPSYLMAIAIGRLEFKPISERAGVFAEPERLDEAVYEFADTERMIAAAEALYGEYRWGRYDLLILPPSFPYGGMENPRLSFITPTVIAGDRSLVQLIAHELAHSWSGNLVTNDTWNSFWLNEGFTSYVENRIIQALFGAERADMEFVLDARGLARDYEQLPVEPSLQRLVQDLTGLDPDAIYTTTSYTKGAWFLRFLEQRVGREPLDTFLREYFDHFAFRSIDNDTFRAWLDEHLLSRHGEAVTAAQIDTWLNEPGIPEFAPVYESAAFARVDGQREAFLAGEQAASELPGADWNTHEWLYFLNGLPAALEQEQLQALDQAFGLTQTGNSEIAFAWYLIGINNGYPAIRPGLEQFLVEVGRRKFVVPLYRALAERESDRRWGRSIYQRARPGYHPITSASVDEIFSQTQP
ncbi:MAG: M1 family metallopeptidase [Xanthomonadales bacterium]|nr:M1 family metallopeptidase [Xanthomonadales bacterium]